MAFDMRPPGTNKALAFRILGCMIHFFRAEVVKTGVGRYGDEPQEEALELCGGA
jgi:hypothetical protein